MTHMVTNEFITMRIPVRHRILVDQLRRKLGVSSRAAVLRLAIERLATEEGVA
ncbi:MAG TPA: hypothetical protein PLN56_11325 [Methanoregulaceae archaeon]|nr:hypothetical protein [Methanoregulaceae archaeon]